MPNSRSGEERWNRLKACDCTTWANPKIRRSLSAVGGIRTASRASHAFAEAIRWLTGQIPQMRAIKDGISENGRPSQNFSKPRNWVTWKRASSTRPSSLRCSVILAWPSILVTGSIMIVLVDVASTRLGSKTGFRAQVWPPAFQKLSQREVYGVGRGRAARNKHIDRNDLVHGPHSLQQFRDDLVRHPGIK